ncbi:acyltransferase family protein [Pedobacter sp. SYSU D00535]|uniref:acyltransferase family protein n=1 Tax=Pedobacter sp. SYSU D00535 TaxID=2810308 RepID=UPI001A96A885|nr:acyltransferase family protein [Pedobacter sp. SYSU D00535]
MSVHTHHNSIANLRVLAIAAIVLNHAQIGIAEHTEYSAGYIIYSQFSKFGSILFMVISGFLFQKSVLKYKPTDLISKKVTTVLIPSLFFMLPWLILNIAILPFVGEKTTEVTEEYVYAQVYNIFFRSIYWFPINLFLIFIVNSFIRDTKVLKNLFIPAVLVTLFYSLNIYQHWVPRRHNSALLGYFSFFFAGRLLQVHYGMIKSLIETYTRSFLHKTGFAVLLLLFFGMAAFETYTIQATSTTDPFNILRASNIIYSGLFLVVLFQIRKALSFASYFKDKSVFLIYLIHPYFLFIGTQLLAPFGPFDSLHTISFVPAEVIYGAIILVLSLQFSKVLLRMPVIAFIINGNYSLKMRSVKSSLSTETLSQKLPRV